MAAVYRVEGLTAQGEWEVVLKKSGVTPTTTTTTTEDSGAPPPSSTTDANAPPSSSLPSSSSSSFCLVEHRGVPPDTLAAVRCRIMLDPRACVRYGDGPIHVVRPTPPATPPPTLLSLEGSESGSAQADTADEAGSGGGGACSRRGESNGSGVGGEDAAVAAEAIGAPAASDEDPSLNEEAQQLLTPETMMRLGLTPLVSLGLVPSSAFGSELATPPLRAMAAAAAAVGGTAGGGIEIRYLCFCHRGLGRRCAQGRPTPAPRRSCRWWQGSRRG